MDSPGSYFLLIGGTDFTITNAGTYVGDWLTDLDGMSSASVMVDFRAGTGGEADVRAFLQTSLDDGNTPIDLACCLFSGSERRVFNIAADMTSTTFDATDAALSDDTVLGGILGNRLRLKLVTTGTWVNTFLGGRVVVR
jgi:hypothetical protein